MLGPYSNILTAAYQSAYGSETLCYVVTVPNTATRLGTLLVTAGSSFTNGIPLIPDEIFGTNEPTANAVPKFRPPWHVMFQVPAGAANAIYCTWDNNTAPVVGGPGLEFENNGTIYLFENAGVTMLRRKASGIYQVNALSAFQFIATADTSMIVTFSD
jgi:hypothetical protein